jgi:hypothetical protein
MTEEELVVRLKFQNDFETYAKHCLKIRTKDGGMRSFSLNKAQLYVNSKLEEQIKRTGKVRAIILKGRQQGMSTLVEGRFYWKVTHRNGVRAFILTHDKEATNNLFDMVQRYHANCPDIVRPSAGISNAKELLFDRLDSGYKVGTAGNKGVGRSSTIQYFHGSEAAFWPNAHEHAKGIMQAVPGIGESEVIIESTAFGVGNYFHSQWEMALANESEFIPIFVPWFWQPEYSIPVGEDFSLDDYETEIRDLYKLTNEQMSWRKNKIQQLSINGLNADKAFKQEYPCNPNEAFQMSGIESLIPTEYVVKGMQSTVEGIGPKIMGVDPAWTGTDRTSIVFRQGRKVYNLESIAHNPDVMVLTGKLYTLIKKENPNAVFIDVTGGLGAGIVDRLKEMGCNQVKGVNSSQSPLNGDIYANKRAEMWCEMKKWLIEEVVELPKKESLHKDLCSITADPNSSGKVILESKKSLQKRGIRSPDEGDALALTFSFPCANNSTNLVKNLLNPTIRL